MLNPKAPALILAPMEGITDAPMRALQGETGAFTFAVSEFLRVSTNPLGANQILRSVPELANNCATPTGLHVQIQLLGGDPELMAESAHNAICAGAQGVDINFGCPAKTVNKHDGGASLLRHPHRIFEIVSAVREAVPPAFPVSAKLRLGWDNVDDIRVNADMAQKGGASWLTVHARTRTQGYLPPVFWKSVGNVKRGSSVPIVANGDIWNFEDFLQCREETNCLHFMIGRGALSNLDLPALISRELGLPHDLKPFGGWSDAFHRLSRLMRDMGAPSDRVILMKLKQWIKIAHLHGSFHDFDKLKVSESLADFFSTLGSRSTQTPSVAKRTLASS